MRSWRIRPATAVGIHLALAPASLVAVVVAVLLRSGVFATFSLLVACIVKTRERFVGIGQLMSMPLFFAGNAIYPVDVMPAWLRAVAAVNPLTYLVDALRTAMLQPAGAGLARARRRRRRAAPRARGPGHDHVAPLPDRRALIASRGTRGRKRRQEMATADSVKQLAAASVLVTSLLLATLAPGSARAAGMGGGFGGGASGGVGGGHAGGFGGQSGGLGGHTGGFGGHSGFGEHPGVGGPRRFAGPQGFVGHRGFYHDEHGRGFVFVGPGFYWWPSYPYDDAPAGYWYYCPSLDLYYPYTESCPDPWVAMPPD